MARKIFYSNSANNAEMYNRLPQELLAEFGEMGQDSMTILKKVLEQYEDLFKAQEEALMGQRSARGAHYEGSWSKERK